MQLGFIGLGKMGANMVHRIHRDSEHQCVVFDFNADAVGEAEGHGASGLVRRSRTSWRSSRRRARSGSWCRPASSDPADGGHAGGAARVGRHDHRRRQLALVRRQAAPGGAGAEGDQLRRRRRQRRRLGPPGRLLHDGRRARRGGRAARAGPRRARAATHRGARARLGPLRPDRRGPLREDGPQRRGVRDDAGLRRGLLALRRVRVRARQREDRPPLDAGLGRTLVAVRARRARVRAGGQRSRRARAVRGGLGRGPLDGRGRDRQAHSDAR